MMGKAWFLYVIRCKDDTLYTGITTDVERRFQEHQGQSKKCAKYLRGRAPLKLLCFVEVGAREEALRLENQIKKMSRADKESWIQSVNDD